MPKMTREQKLEVMKRLRVDFRFFCEHMIILDDYSKMSPTDKQMEAFDSMEDPDYDSVFLSCRGGGKSCLTAARDCWKLMYGKGWTCVLFAPVLDQTNIIFGMIQDFFRRNPFLVGFTRKFKESGITMKNGNWITVKSGSPKAQKRGRHPAEIQIDESQDIEDYVYYAEMTASSTTKVHGGKGSKILETGTPKGRNHFYQVCQTPDEFGYKVTRQHWRECPLIDLEKLAKVRKKMPSEWFKQEYELHFNEDEGAAFPLRWLKLMWEDYEFTDIPVQGGKYYAGVDIGKHPDQTVIAVIQAKVSEMEFLDLDEKKFKEKVWVYRLVNLVRLSSISYKEIKERIVKVLERYQPELTYIDRKGSGEPILDMILDEDCRGKVGSIMEYLMDHSSKRQDKEDLVSNALLLMEQQRAEVREEVETKKQFMGWQKFKLPSGIYRYDHPVGEHDDIVIALLLAWMAGEDATEAGVRIAGGTTSFSPEGTAEGYVFTVDEDERQRMNNQWF